ncbi:unnamed protein product [Lampetra planeri]
MPTPWGEVGAGRSEGRRLHSNSPANTLSPAHHRQPTVSAQRRDTLQQRRRARVADEASAADESSSPRRPSAPTHVVREATWLLLPWGGGGGTAPPPPLLPTSADLNASSCSSNGDKKISPDVHRHVRFRRRIDSANLTSNVFTAAACNPRVRCSGSGRASSSPSLKAFAAHDYCGQIHKFKIQTTIERLLRADSQVQHSHYNRIVLTGESPSGRVTLVNKSHYCTANVYVNKGEKFPESGSATRSNS